VKLSFRPGAGTQYFSHLDTPSRATSVVPLVEVALPWAPSQIQAKSQTMKTETNDTFTIAVSGIAREDLESLLKGVMAQQRDAQPKVEAAQPLPTAKDFGPPQRL
jgi:hypothetical protein